MKLKVIKVEVVPLDLGQDEILFCPGPRMANFPYGGFLHAELRRPDGLVIPAVLCVSPAFTSPPDFEHHLWCFLQGVLKAKVPLGTEVWFDPENYKEDE